MEKVVDFEHKVQAEPESPWKRVLQKLRGNPRVVVLALAVLLVALILMWHHFAIRESTDDAQIDGHIVTVSAKVGGMVVNVGVNDNQFVQAGSVLLQVDPRDYQVAVQRAEADLAQAQADAEAAHHEAMIGETTSENKLETAAAGLESVRSQLTSAQNQVAAAQARLASAQAKARQAEANSSKSTKDLERFKELVAKDEISQREYDAAVAVQEEARAALDAANADVAESQQNVSMAEGKVNETRQTLLQAQAGLSTARTAPHQNALTQAQASSAEAEVEQMKAALEQAKMNLQHAEVRAPVSGWISKKSLEMGQVIQPGQPLLAIVPLENLWVTANFKETQLKKMHPGQEAIVVVDTYGGREYHAHVESMSPATGAKFSLLPPENASGNYVKVVQRIPVKIALEKGQDPNHLLRPGMSAEVTVLLK